MNIIFPFEMVGTVAFAFSGAIVAINRKMDLFGVAILGMTTAVGGGIIRDMILGAVPPASLVNPVYALVAIAVALATFVLMQKGLLRWDDSNESRLYTVMDSVGLGVFTVVGMEKAFATCGDNAFLAIFVGMLTGVGGGTLCDMFAGLTPHVFVKHVYATASLLGGILCALLRNTVGSAAAMLLSGLFIVVLRLLAAHYHWNLPTAK